MMTDFNSLPAAQRQQHNRIRVRCARSIPAMVADAVATASVEGHARIVTHGGGVANCYGYPADTQAAGVSVVRVSDTAYRVLAEFDVLAANKVTLSGAAACTLGKRGPWDQRVGTKRATWDRLDIIADTLTRGVRVEA